MTISLIIPSYNEEDNIFPFFELCMERFKSYEKNEVEYIFINDGSKDRTNEKIKSLIQKYKPRLFTAQPWKWPKAI